MNYRNNVDYLILTLIQIALFEVLFAAFNTVTAAFTSFLVATTLLLGAPHMALIFYICYVLAKKAGITQAQCLKKNGKL